MAGNPNRPGRRHALLARVHILVKELRMDDDAYREALYGAFGVRSSKALSDGQLAHFADMLARQLPDKHAQRRRAHPGAPHNLVKPAPSAGSGQAPGEPSRNAQLRKIEALLAEAGYPWSYADALAQRICKVERMAFVPAHALYKIITALELDAKRHGRARG
jgi:phage gp16-like protein